MKMKKLAICLVSVVLGLGVASISVAEPSGHGGDKGMHEKMQGKSMQGGKMGGHGPKHKMKKKMGGTFMPHWVKTLSDEQKMSFDKMHLAVGQYAAVQNAKIKMLKAELNVLVAKKSGDKSAIYSKIDEILDAKRGVMRNRFDHIAEMRAELTDQQRISYDMGTLKRGKPKH